MSRRRFTLPPLEEIESCSLKIVTAIEIHWPDVSDSKSKDITIDTKNGVMVEKAPLALLHKRQKSQWNNFTNKTIGDLIFFSICFRQLNCSVSSTSEFQGIWTTFSD